MEVADVIKIPMDVQKVVLDMAGVVVVERALGEKDKEKNKA